MFSENFGSSSTFIIKCLLFLQTTKDLYSKKLIILKGNCTCDNEVTCNWVSHLTMFQFYGYMGGKVGLTLLYIIFSSKWPEVRCPWVEQIGISDMK